MGVSAEALERRAAAAPRPTYPADLPIVERREEILAALRDPGHQVLVVAGETGSGKSTQLPKLCLEAGRGIAGLIGHTQPRRIAARAVAERVAEELGTEVGDAVGYTVRFTDRVGPGTYVKVMTDGILLAELQRDRDLSAYDTIIVDEAHERSLNVDFLLGYLKQLLPRRPDLKVVITSATIDTARFAEHFGGAPVVEVGGRTYPVEVRYRPIGAEPDDDRDQVQAVCDAVEELAAEGPGDVLVFLSGEREIRDTAEAVARLSLRDTEVVPLFARLSAEEQHRVFRPHRGRRIVCATNVAETSLTVPGIRYVVDPGTARISRYNRRTKVQRLPIEPISQASAAQRAGRCGRIGPGVCIRLYAEDDHDARPAYTDPEVLRTNLASVILRMASIGLGPVERFPFLDPPDARAVADGVALLRELGALDGDRRDRITRLGRRLAQLPVDPRLGRMVLEADRNGCAGEVLVIAAALSIQDPRERPIGAERAADELHARFADPRSDFVSILNLWRYLQDQKRHLGSSAFRRLCRDEYLHHLRVREWQDLHGQLRQVARAVGVRLTGERDPDGLDPDALHRSVLAGLLSQIGAWDARRRDYEGTRQARFTVAPGSSLGKVRPRWVMAAELVETDRLRARTVAGIRPQWIEPLAGHLVKRSHGEPWWDPARGAAAVEERVTLHGLTIVAGRTVQLGRVDPVAARATFLQRALVEGDWDGGDRHDFLRHNRELVAEVRSLEDRLRRSDLLVGDDVLFAFFDDRLPGDVVSGGHFERWWRDEGRRRPDLLVYPPELLLRPGVDADVTGFPDRWIVDGWSLPLAYRHEPGSALDGVTVDVPIALLPRLDAAPFEWQVPGLRLELLTALIRSLPKTVRRRLGPAPDLARDALEQIGPEGGALLPSLARHLARSTGEAVAAHDFDVAAVPDHLRPTFRAVDERGRAMAWSKDLGALRARLSDRARAAVAAGAAEHERSGLTTWDLGALPASVDAGGVTGYPALVDEGDSVAVRVLPMEAEQRRAMWSGTRRLLLLGLSRSPSSLVRSLDNAERLGLAAGTGAAADVVDDCATATADHLLRELGGPVWDGDAFEVLAARFGERFPGVALDALRAAARILVAAREVDARLERLVAPAVQPAVADIRSHVRRLTGPGFVTDAGIDRLGDVERYVAADARRLDKLAADPARDRALLGRIHALEDHPAAGHVRWPLEELRVSFFAQALGTRGAVSEQRIRRELARWQQGA